MRSLKKAKRMTILVATIAVTLGGTTWAFFRHYDYYSAANEKANSERAYKAAGLPWQASDLHSKPPVSPDENAAPFIERAIKAMPTAAFQSSASEDRQIRALQNAGDYRALLKRVDRYPEGMRLIALAAELPRLDFKRDWDQGVALLMPEEAKVKWFVKRLALLAEAKAGLGDSKGAAVHLLQAWRLSGLIGQEPDMIPLLVELSCTAVTLTGIQRCSAVLKDNPAALQNLLQILDKIEEPDLLNAYRGAAYVGLAALRGIKGDFRKSEIGSWMPLHDDRWVTRADRKIDDWLPSGVKLEAYKVRYLQAWTQMAQAMDRYMDDPYALGRAMNQVAIQQGKTQGESYWISFMYPVFDQCATGVVKRQANVLATKALVEALLIRAKTGKLPARIEEIPGTWSDPFAKPPLRLKRSGDSLRVYSVGEDRKDQGGFTNAELIRPKRTDDIVAAYPPVKLKL